VKEEIMDRQYSYGGTIQSPEISKLNERRDRTMKTAMKISVVLVAVMLVGSVSMAQYRGGGHYGGGDHYGYYHNARGEWVFGLLGLGVIAAVEANRPVYVQQPVVYQTSPNVVYVQQPQVVYQTPPVVQQPSTVQQPVQVAPPVVQSPVTTTVKVTNSNGSYIPVTLHQEGAQWVGPKGEYYDKMPTSDQLRPVYGL